MKGHFEGRVLDVGGGRRRGRFQAPAGRCWIIADVSPAMAAETTSCGETYERQLLTRRGRARLQIELILARGEPHPAGGPE